MELEGRLNSTISLPEIIQFLGMNRMTGTFTLVGRDRHAVSLDLKQGKLVGSLSVNRPRRLGQILLNWGLADRQTIRDVIDYQKNVAPGTPLGRILVQREVITSEDLKRAVRMQVEEEFWDLFTLQNGAFKFEHKNDSEVGKDFLIELDVEPLIIEGTRRLDEWVDIKKNIPTEKHVPHIVPFQDAFEREMINLSEKEWNILSLVNGRYNMDALSSRSGIGQFDTFRIINSFITNGLVKLTLDKESLPISIENSDFSEMEVPEDNDAIADSSSKLEKIVSILQAPNRKVAVNGSDSVTIAVHTFENSVSFLTCISQRVVDELMGEPNFIVDSRDERFAELYWNEILMRYPRADLIKVVGNSVSSDEFDRFTEKLGVDGPLRAVYLETNDALTRFLRTVYLVAAQRLGRNAARKIIGGQLTSIGEASVINNSKSFDLSELAVKTLE